jgi:lipopolysaccharide transport protein LptA
MAASFPDAARTRLAAALACCFAAGLVSAAAPELPRPSKELPIELVAASSDFDYKKNTLLFKQVKITQGPMIVEAQEATATGLNFENSEWTLTGQVRITVPDGKLTSADAKVNFRDNQIAKAVIRGTPAEFEQRVKETQQLAQGHAQSIEYDVQGGVVRLDGDAWLTDGVNVIRGKTLVYDIAKQRVAANPGGTDPGGVRITINPKSQDKPGTKPDSKPGTKNGAKPDAKPAEPTAPVVPKQ